MFFTSTLTLPITNLHASESKPYLVFCNFCPHGKHQEAVMLDLSFIFHANSSKLKRFSKSALLQITIEDLLLGVISM